MEIFDKPGRGRLEKPQVQMVQKKVLPFTKIGSWRRQPGHRIFSFNIKTKEIKEVQVVAIAEMTINGQVKEKQKVFCEKDCFYGEALNLKNFKKLLRREGYDIL